MEISPTLLDKVQALDHGNFVKIKETEFRPSYDIMGLKYLRDKAGNERNLRELYRNRAPYELLQNADDVGAKKVAFFLANDGLAFVHDGHWFTLDNFRSLADGWSDKDPDQCIGHKGLGFRSILDITPAPYLLKVDTEQFFAVKFTWALNYNHIHKAFQENSSLRHHYEKWTKHGQIACPVMAIPGLAKKHNLGLGSKIYNKLVAGGFGDRYSTMFWFPAVDPEIDRKVLEDISPKPIIADPHGRKVLLRFLNNEVRVLLPFLSSIEEVKLFYNDRKIGVVKIPERTESSTKENKISIHAEINEEIYVESFFKTQFRFPIPIQIRNDPETPKAVKWMKEASIAFLLRIENDQPKPDDESNFHVYFPTDEITGTGFVIHGDFYVKPDRTRLMTGVYNDWLLKEAANRTANEFLSQLINIYNPGKVFEALSPSSPDLLDSAEIFVNHLSDELKGRKKPFIPSKCGLLTKEEVILPPKIDTEGFWEDQFSDVVDTVLEGKKAFIDYAIDNQGIRAFLRLANVRTLNREIILDFIEASSDKNKSYNWWYRCYSYLAQDEKLALLDHSHFVGRKLIPAIGQMVIAVPEEGSYILCFPPTKDSSNLTQPDCFKEIFTFLANELADLLNEGPDVVSSWVTDRFKIARFEATDLIPRAVRGIAPQLFSGKKPISSDELQEVWVFMNKIVQDSRSILSQTFWHEVGRFPVPIKDLSSEKYYSPDDLVPAFLSYWPDSYINNENCLEGIDNLRRIDVNFLNKLFGETDRLKSSWLEFFKKAGVSAGPKLLRYARILTAKKDLPFEYDGLEDFKKTKFIGEYQHDMNIAVIELLKLENIWPNIVDNAENCDHEIPKILQSLSLMDGIGQCAQMADVEFQTGTEKWNQRLKALMKNLPLSSLDDTENDKAFCRGGQGGHSIDIGSYLKKQLSLYCWLPSTNGPTNSSECFLRQSSRRIISAGRADEELGDKLLPYVVVDGIDEMAVLQRLGIEVLDDFESSTPHSLVRALGILGDRLSTDWGRQEILDVRGRWRLVRGAIQEIYRSLNYHQDSIDFPENYKLAVRSTDGIRFISSPLFYAEPGSAIEKAFKEDLSLIDTDRVYPNFFDQAGIPRLISGQTVNEEFLSENNSKGAKRFITEINNGLAIYLLAPIIAKTDRTRQAELIVRRLKKRFKVKAAPKLVVSFSLTTDPTKERSIEFPMFYLQRRSIQKSGAIEEYHYTLYMKGSVDQSISNIDADALGESIAPLFLDGTTDELKGLFPRIASRYQHIKGEPSEIRNYLYHQLGISLEAQESAHAMLTGKTPLMPEEAIPAPPPVKIVQKNLQESSDNINAIEERVNGHKKTIDEKTRGFIGTLITFTSKGKTDSKISEKLDADLATRKSGGISTEQKDRGKIGEEEIKRRLELPSGWEGIVFHEDKRFDGCGYDFLCGLGNRKVKLEVKTFTENGRVILTPTELQQAAASRTDYYLIGVLDNGKPAYEWQAFLLQDPISLLLSCGEFDIQTKLQASPSDLFELD